jgi:lipopolysaccharide export LptBFGC system permease protein LptF
MRALPDKWKRALLRRHFPPFVIAFALLTAALLANLFARQLPRLLSSGASLPFIGEVYALSLSFIVPETLPLALFIAVVYVFSDIDKDAQSVHTLRLVAPVFLASVGVAGMALCWSDQILPRSNHQLRMVLSEIEPRSSTVSPGGARSDREMTLRELREVVRTSRDAERRATARGSQKAALEARRRAAAYAVEIQKKYAIAAACIAVVLLGAPLGLRIPGGGWWIAGGASFPVAVLYYLCLVGGEDLGDRLVVSPFLAMWTPDLIVGAVGVLLLWLANGKPTSTRKLGG